MDLVGVAHYGGDYVCSRARAIRVLVVVASDWLSVYSSSIY